MRVSLIILFGLIAFGCSKPESSGIVVFDKYDYSLDGITLSEITYKIELSEGKINYLLNQDTVSYIIQLCPKFKGNVNKLDGKTSDIVMEGFMEYNIGGRNFRIYRLSYDKHIVDAGVDVYWAEDVGVLLQRNTTWKDFIKLRSHPKLTDEQIKALFSVLMNDMKFNCVESDKESQVDLEELDLDLVVTD